MINLFLRRKARFFKSVKVSGTIISKSKKVLFAIFTRYGDTIIDLVVIKEFISKYPKKDYLILCPDQMLPYVNEILPDVSCINVNKRNLFQMIKVHWALKSWRPDVGFNPWSNGLDSCYFLSYCKSYLCYKDFLSKNNINHYEVVRKYLQLKPAELKLKKAKLDSVSKLLICPQSTDIKRSMGIEELRQAISFFKDKHKNLIIFVAAMSKEFDVIENVNFFNFKKNKKSSQDFICLVKNSDMVVAVDSAPLHISIALGKNTLPIFKITKQEMVLNSNSVCLDRKHYDF